MADSPSSASSSSPLKGSSSTSSSSAADDEEGVRLLPSDSEDESQSDQKEHAAQVPGVSADNDMQAEVESPGDDEEEEAGEAGAEGDMDDKNFMKVTHGVQKKVRAFIIILMKPRFLITPHDSCGV